jgi:aspartokinase
MRPPEYSATLQFSSVRCPGDALAIYLEHLSSACDELRDLLRAVWVARHCPPALAAAISGAGEVLSAPLFAAAAAARRGGVRAVDSRELIVLESAADPVPVIDWEASEANTKRQEALQADTDKLGQPKLFFFFFSVFFLIFFFF